MADTEFKVWDESLTNEVSANDFNDPTGQRGKGFAGGSPASSSFVNSGLREGTLFATAFMQAMTDAGIDTSNVNFLSSIANVQGLIEQYVQPKVYRHHFILRTKNIDNTKTLGLHFDIFNSSSSKIIQGSSGRDSLSYVAAYINNTYGRYSEISVGSSCCWTNNSVSSFFTFPICISSDYTGSGSNLSDHFLVIKYGGYHDSANNLISVLIDGSAKVTYLYKTSDQATDPNEAVSNGITSEEVYAV